MFCLCYDITNVPLPQRVLAHDIISQAALVVLFFSFFFFLKGRDICMVMTWLVHTFTVHYVVSQTLRSYARFGESGIAVFV